MNMPQWNLDRRVARIATSAMVAGLIGALSSSAMAAFPDAHDPPPPGWTGPVFKLSQNYPANLPSLEPLAKRKWRQFDPRVPAQAPQYLKAVLDYCLEGNTPDNFNNVGTKAGRKWYHTPWLHTTDSGREFIHGMTRERPSRITNGVPELGPAQTEEHDNWAVGFYNTRGAYTIGQVWKDPLKPDPTKAKFPSNTVACKLLFTTAPVAQVPFLEGSLKWEADIERSSSPTEKRPELLLLQLDVAVKDDRANATTGWVFGTFQYEKDASTSPNWWEHLVPVGLMWGSDVTNVLANQPPTQQWINTDRGQKLHLGFRGLLNGPIDNPNSSCTGCHGFAQVNRVNAPIPSIPRVPVANASVNSITRYFTNIKSFTPFSPDYYSADYSLQLQIGIARAISSGQVTLPANAAVPITNTLREPLPTRGVPVTREQ
jgi:hypothetical protein